MDIHAYVNGKYLFTIKNNVLHENVHNKNDSRDYIGIRGSEEIVSVLKDIEQKLQESGIKASFQDELSSDSLDKINISDYLAKKYPGLERLELRADDDSYTSKLTNIVGKQYGYPLVWLNCNNTKGQEHQWERCLFQTEEDLDKISSLVEHFKAQKVEDEQALYQGGVSSVLDSLKNSITDNLWLTERRIGTQVGYEITLMDKFDKDKGFAFYEDTTQDIYITDNIDSCLKDILERNLFDNQVLQEIDDFGEITGGTSKTIKILSPVTVRNQNYSHVTMQTITLSMVNNKIDCDVTLFEGLLSDPFKDQELNHVGQTKQQVSNFFPHHKLEMNPISTNVRNLKLQLPLQTHCGRFVMTWMAAEVAGVDITKLSNYSEPFNQIFGKIDKNGDKIFPSGDKRVAPEKALNHFIENLKSFLQVREKEFANQIFSSGADEIKLTKELITVLNQLLNKEKPENLGNVEQKIQYLSDIRLKKIINEGMANLGFGSINTFLTQAKTPGFKISLPPDQVRDIPLQKEKIDLDLEDDFQLIDEPKKDIDLQKEEEDDFALIDDVKPEIDENQVDDLFIVPEIDASDLATNVVYPIDPRVTMDMKDKLTKIKTANEEEVPTETVFKVVN